MFSIYAAAILDAIAGDPYWLPHPVRLIGKYIKAFENKALSIAKTPGVQRAAGILLTVTTVMLAYGITFGLLRLALNIHPVLYYGLNILFMYTCLAAKCLCSEAYNIYRLLNKGDLDAARKQTSMIVGRDTESLDESEIARAVVETVAENASDGVIAPLFYMALGGAPLAMAYKAVNTLDSMVGYRNDRYMYFGWSSARFDDLVNYVPARLTAAFMVIGAFILRLDFISGASTAVRDGRNHSSPNSGYPEAAVAGALGIRLGGTNHYFGKPVFKPTIGQSKRPIAKGDILQTNKVMISGYIVALLFSGIIYYICR